MKGDVKWVMNVVTSGDGRLWIVRDVGVVVRDVGVVVKKNVLLRGLWEWCGVNGGVFCGVFDLQMH